MPIYAKSVGPNKKKVDGHPFDFHPTPENWSRVIFRHETFKGNILEPCNGNGAMSRVIAVNCPDNPLVCSDIEPYRMLPGAPPSMIRDAFEWGREDGIENIITNPPYGILNMLLVHFMNITQRKLVLLLKTVSLEGVGRGEFYKLYPPTKVIVISNRMRGSQFGHSFIIWDTTKRRHPGRTELVWDTAK